MAGCGGKISEGTAGRLKAVGQFFRKLYRANCRAGYEGSIEAGPAEGDRCTAKPVRKPVVNMKYGYLSIVCRNGGGSILEANESRHDYSAKEPMQAVAPDHGAQINLVVNNPEDDVDTIAPAIMMV